MGVGERGEASVYNLFPAPHLLVPLVLVFSWWCEAVCPRSGEAFHRSKSGTPATCTDYHIGT